MNRKPRSPQPSPAKTAGFLSPLSHGSFSWKFDGHYLLVADGKGNILCRHTDMISPTSP
ncbi:MAG: hypothetical protein HQL52_10510 [Magnetococcales bacterium]|nr:hypothetical protein [Magnetococcales bacterium]